MSDKLYFEDFEVGQKFTSREYTVSRESALAFSREFDPQVQHLDEELAKETLLGGLTVSGWHTAAIAMRLKTETPLGKVATGLVGMGVDKLKWPRPVFPGDTLHIEITVLEKRLSNSQPGKGVVRYTVQTFNQKQELVYENTPAVLMPLKAA